MLTSRLPGVLRKALGSHWEFTRDGDDITIEHPSSGTPYCPPRRHLSWPDLLAALESAFADLGVPRAAPLPLRWGRETELTISAVQALDPYLKHRRPVPFRQGFLPQPVVRLTGKRDEHGKLRDGFLTSFVNTSRIQPISDVSAYGTILDEWLTVLSRLGLHARHIKIYGSLRTWRRREVEGVTLFYDHARLPLGDIVLLWNAEDPSHMAVDLGSGLERLGWVRSRRSWNELIHGRLAGMSSPTALDAIRTATLLIGQGIVPTARGAGSVARRVMDRIPRPTADLGFERAVRQSHAYWSDFALLAMPWPEVAVTLMTATATTSCDAGHGRKTTGRCCSP